MTYCLSEQIAKVLMAFAACICNNVCFHAILLNCCTYIGTLAHALC